MSPTRSSGSEPTCTGRWRIRFGLAPRLHSIGPMTSWPGESTISRPVSDPRLEPVPEEASAMTQLYHRHDITLDQVVALKTAATRLGRDFDGTFNIETLDRFLHSSYDQFAGHATIANFLPLLAARFARQRLRRLVRWLRTRRPGQPLRHRSDEGTRHRHLNRVPQAVDRRDRPRRRRCHHHGLR